MKQLIDEIVKKNIEELKENDNIISIFLVGSMAKEDYQEKLLNDYDIRFIVKEMNVNTYILINKILDKIKKEIENYGIGCQISDVIGPVKMEPINKSNVLLHSITMTEKELNLLPAIHRYSYYSTYQQIYGNNLIDKYENIVLTPNDVIFSVEGIDFCINLIKKRENSYTKWIINNNQLELIRKYSKASNNDLIELFYYSYNKSKNNINNMIKTNQINKKIEDYIEITPEENKLINKIETNNLLPTDINDTNLNIIQKILYKLEEVCLIIYKSSKKYYNSLEWGIIDLDSKDMRKNGFEYLKRIQLPTGNNFSMEYKEYILRKKAINKIISDSKYIIIFEPPNKNSQRYGINNIDSTVKIDSYISDNDLNLEKYNISFIEIIKEVSNSYAGTVISDGRGNTIIEIINGTCDTRELTSTGAESDRIHNYNYSSFDDNIIGAPIRIKEIKEICQFFRGYYEFAYGEIRGVKDIYFTYYSPNEEYINIFEGGKTKCKNITK